MNWRRSDLALVVARLLVDGRACLLLRAHEKWGDWGLVGGHVEPLEVDDWGLSASREVEEELAPLRVGVDVDVHPLPVPTSRWGPTPSRSAGNRLTVYEAEWFSLAFRRSPTVCMARVVQGRLLLVEQSVALAAEARSGITPLLAIVHEALPGGLDSVPLAWPEEVAASLLPPIVTLRLATHVASTGT